MEKSRGGQRTVPVGVRSQIPDPFRPTVWDLASATVHLNTSVTAVAGRRFLW